MNAVKWTIAIVGMLLLLFLYFVWPTPWQEWSAYEGKQKHLTLLRVNRFTGERQVGFPGMLGMVHWVHVDSRN
jgi:hypothetical protein